MTNAIQPTSLIPVQVTADWSVAQNAINDVIASLEASFPGVFQFPLNDDFDFTMVQLQAGHTAVGVLEVTGGALTGHWDTGYGTYPTVGSTCYIIDMYF
jgi:hypothetical protein